MLIHSYFFQKFLILYLRIAFFTSLSTSIAWLFLTVTGNFISSSNLYRALYVINAPLWGYPQWSVYHSSIHITTKSYFIVNKIIYFIAIQFNTIYPADVIFYLIYGQTISIFAESKASHKDCFT